MACTFFLCAGLALAPRLGIQNDEALFAAGIFPPFEGLSYTRWVFAHKVPLMLMSYLGCLKSWLYAGIFRLWAPGPVSMRIPMVLAGAASVWLFFLLLRRISDTRVALAGCLLLATDTMYLLTACFDWGPVAIQHLALTGGTLLLVTFYQERRWPALAGGFFLLGLGLWDKALFIWLLAGLAAAALAVFPRQVLRATTPPRAALAVLAFALGALPLILYNGSHRLETFRSNVGWADRRDLPGKARVLRGTLDGSLLFGWMVREDVETPVPRPPATVLERASCRLSLVAGHPTHGFQFYAFLLAVGLFLWFCRDGLSKLPVRILLFILVFMAVAWAQMVFARDAGGSVHHSILLWPAPQAFMAVAFGEAARRLGRYGTAAMALLLAVLVPANVAVTNEYMARMVRNGGALNWSDAIYPLADYMRKLPAGEIYVGDWGIFDSLRMLNRGQLALRVGADPADREAVRSVAEDPAHVFVGHVEGQEFFTGAGKKLAETAAGQGFRREPMRIIPDSLGRPVFEVYRFAR